jgi:hypothetical protein
MNANELKVLEDALQVIETLQAEIEALKDSSYEKGFIDGMAQMTESAVHKVVQGLVSDDVKRYRWLRAEFEAGRETYLAEGMPSGERLDEYIDEQLRRAQEK